MNSLYQNNSGGDCHLPHFKDGGEYLHDRDRGRNLDCEKSYSSVKAYETFKSQLLWWGRMFWEDQETLHIEVVPWVHSRTTGSGKQGERREKCAGDGTPRCAGFLKLGSRSAVSVPTGEPWGAFFDFWVTGGLRHELLCLFCYGPSSL